MPGGGRYAGLNEAQAVSAFRHELALERHHESALPSQRYAGRHGLPPPRNPITPLGTTGPYASTMSLEAAVTSSTTSAPLNGTRARQREMMANPVFGYSTHQLPPVRTYDMEPKSASDRERELRLLISREREKRAAAEALLRTHASLL